MSKIEQLQNLLIETPTDSFLNYALALEFVKANEHAKAEVIFDKLIRHDANYLATYLQYGNLLAIIGNNEKAACIYEMGIKIAAAQNNIKTRQELEQALFLLD